MGNVTRHALRVYAALAELKGNNADVLDALIPFFEPILEQLNGKIFNPAIFASGVHFLYRWQFNKDIAEQFIPRLIRKGYLEKKVEGRDTIYIVRYERAPTEQSDILELLEKIIDEFEKFPPRVTDLLTYKRTRDQLKDILIKFLVAMDAYSDGLKRAREQELRNDGSELLARLDDGGPQFSRDDRYMAARFVKAVSAERPEWIPYLSRLAAIGLLTEVVEDFVKPVQPAGSVDLTIVVDAPLALDYLGCSGKSLQRDVKGIFDSLRKIGCTFVVFPDSFVEIRRNLTSMLSLPAAKRRGYTHEAMAKGEVLKDFVESVANDPEKALARVGIGTKHLSLDQYPNTHVHFSQDQYDDFFEVVQWVPEIEPREHDASALTLIMRLRQGKHSSDVFKCGYVFVTRNATFVKSSRQYCISSGLLSPVQQGPLIHQRELATITWLRTGLGEEDTVIPTNNLLATCDRILQIRSEVPDAVAATLRQATPDKIEQFELLLQDHRSIRKLADETLNDERVVTAENAEHLLDVMRRATIEEETAKHKKEMEDARARHLDGQRKLKQEMEEAQGRHLEDEQAKQREVQQAQTDRDHAITESNALKAQQQAIIMGLANSLNSQLDAWSKFISFLMFVLVVTAILQTLTGWPSQSFTWQWVVNVGGLLGLYHLVTALLGKPMLNLTTLLNFVAPILLDRKLDQLNLNRVSTNDFEFSGGKVIYKPRSSTLA